MARRKAAMHRKRKQNRFAMFLVSFALLMLLAAVGVKKIELESKQDAYLQKEAELQKKIDEEKARSQELEEYEKYTQTQKYVEDVAKEKLGLVYEDEIVFKEE